MRVVQPARARPAAATRKRLFFRSIGLALDRDELDFEDQRGVRRNDGRRSAFAVAERRGDDELALSAGFHARDALVPSLDDAPCTELEVERLVPALGAVELLAVDERARVVHL